MVRYRSHTTFFPVLFFFWGGMGGFWRPVLSVSKTDLCFRSRTVQIVRGPPPPPNGFCFFTNRLSSAHFLFSHSFLSACLFFLLIVYFRVRSRVHFFGPRIPGCSTSAVAYLRHSHRYEDVTVATFGSIQTDDVFTL